MTDVVIGIDFGTSATKVAFRSGDDAVATVVAPRHDQPTWPSTIYFDGRNVSFPLDSAEADRGVSILWMKMLLARPDCTTSDEVRALMAHRLRSVGWTVEQACTTFLAHIMQIARQAVRVQFPASSRRQLHLTYNLAAPLEAFEQTDQAQRNNRVASRFLRVAYLAERLSHVLPDSAAWDARLAADAYLRLDAESPTVPSVADRIVFVVPEIHAAVAGAAVRGRLPDGHYVVVDVGAGTTDIAVFCNHSAIERNGRWAISYFADRVIHLAATDADQYIDALLQREAAAHDIEVGGGEELRAYSTLVRELHCRSDVRCYDRFTVSRDEIGACVQPLCDELWRGFKSCVVEAIRCKTKTGHRHPYFLIRIGGGNRFKPFASKFGAVPFAQGWPHFLPEPMQVNLRGRVQMQCGMARSPLPESQTHLFFVSHGLTTHYVRLPEPWLPSEIEDLLQPPSGREPHVRDDDT